MLVRKIPLITSEILLIPSEKSVQLKISGKLVILLVEIFTK